MEEKVSKLRALQKCPIPFEVSAQMLKEALGAQFSLRTEETRFVARPTRVVKTPPFFVEYFDFDFELGLFCMGRNIAFRRDGFSYLFYAP